MHILTGHALRRVCAFDSALACGSESEWSLELPTFALNKGTWGRGMGITEVANMHLVGFPPQTSSLEL